MAIFLFFLFARARGLVSLPGPPQYGPMHEDMERPAPPASWAEIDLSAERIWPPARVWSLGGWRGRIDQGVTRRANSILALGLPNRALEEALQVAEEQYRGAGLTPCFQMTASAIPEGLDRLLDQRGYQREGESYLMMRSGLPSIVETSREKSSQLRGSPDAAWLDCYTDGRSGEETLAKAAILARIELHRIYASIVEGDETLAVGVGLVDGDWSWVNCLHCRPNARRRGLARRLMVDLLAALSEAGARHHLLQVESDNDPAVGLYRSLGYQTFGGYHYRVLS